MIIITITYFPLDIIIKRIHYYYSSGENFSFISGLCVKCGELAFRTCARCGAFYCKESCQASDWQYHKQNCFKMPYVYGKQLNIIFFF